ncbi:MAG: tetratricopeptide repeat protein [Patescibacteria group bacterium]
MEIKKFYQNKLIVFFAIIVVVLIFYSNIFNNQFAYDDNDFFVNWQTVESLGNAKALVLGDLPLSHQHVYRPLRSLLQAVTYQLFGQNPLGYHFLGLFFYILAIYLLYLIFRKIINAKVAFLSAMIFAVLPVHVEAVTFVTASFDLFGIVLMLASLYFYLLGRNKNKAYLALSLILSLAALFSYELTVVLPLLLVLYDKCSDRGKKIIVSVKENWFYFLGVAVYLAARFYVMKLLNPQSFLTELDPKTIVFTSIKSFSNYVYLAVFNYPLSVNHQTVLSSSIFDFSVVFSIIIFALLLYLSWYFYKKNKSVYTLLIGWFIIGLLPAANLVRVSRFVAERYLFLSSVAFGVLVPLIFFKLFNYFSNKKQTAARIITVIVLVLVFLTYGFMSYVRNNDWQNDETLWQKTLKNETGDTRSLNNLAFELRQKGQNEKAIDYLGQAIKLDPNYYLAYENLGEIYSELNQHDKAIENFNKVIELKPNYFIAYANRGFDYFLLGEAELAEKDYLKALELNPQFYQANLNLGGFYFEAGNFEQAIGYFEKALAIDGSNSEVYEALGLAYLGASQPSAAKASFAKALKINPNSSRARDFLNKLK